MCATCDAIIPDVVIHSADGVTVESRAASTTVSSEIGRDLDQPTTASSTARLEAPWRLRSLNLSAMPVNSRSLPQLPFVAAVEVTDGRPSTDFVADPVSRRSLSSLQSAGARRWRDGLRPAGGSLSSVAVETPLTSSASSAATTAGGGGGSDVSGCVPDSLDDDEPPPPLPPPASTTPPTSQFYSDDLPTPADDSKHSGFRLVQPAANDDRQCPGGPSSQAVRDDEDANVQRRRQRLQQQKRQRQFRRRQRRVATGHPSSNSLDDLQRRTPPKLVQSSASLTSAPTDEMTYCRKDAWKSTGRDASCNLSAVDPLLLPNGNLRPDSATSRTARSTARPSVDGGLRLPDDRSQSWTPHAARSMPMMTTWLANRAHSTVACPPLRARNAWSKSQEIHPKTGGGLCSLRGSASATLIPVRRRNSHHAVFVGGSRTAVLKDVVILAVVCRWCSLNSRDT